ncbi:MAG: hypothetical protein ACTS42_02010 [Candidatus Hodgkinia cicadicola]
MEMTIAPGAIKPSPTAGQVFQLSQLLRHLAYALAWLSGIDIFESTLYADGTFGVLRSALTKGGIIFTDSQPFQHLLEPNAFKHKVICVTRILHLRSKTPCGPFNDVLSKLAAVLTPSSCVLALGTWQLPIAWAINALRSNAIPSIVVVLSPLSIISPDVLGKWVASVATSIAKPLCIIFNLPFGFAVINAMFGVLYYWTPPPPVLAHSAPQLPAQTVTKQISSQDHVHI